MPHGAESNHRREGVVNRTDTIYNGRVGTSAKFLYREISNEMMRPSFSQDIQYDFSASRTFGFKGARINVIDATNTQLTYSVLATFRDQ